MKSDDMTKEMIEQILSDGCLDVNPRPHYSDGTPAHTISINHVMQTYDLSKGELPIITLRPIAYRNWPRKPMSFSHGMIGRQDCFI